MTMTADVIKELSDFQKNWYMPLIDTLSIVVFFFFLSVWQIRCINNRVFMNDKKGEMNLKWIKNDWLHYSTDCSTEHNVCVCTYWGSCQHGRERTIKWTALEPARPPRATPHREQRVRLMPAKDRWIDEGGKTCTTRIKRGGVWWVRAKLLELRSRTKIEERESG